MFRLIIPGLEAGTGTNVVDGRIVLANTTMPHHKITMHLNHNAHSTVQNTNAAKDDGKNQPSASTNSASPPDQATTNETTPLEPLSMVRIDILNTVQRVTLFTTTVCIVLMIF